MAIAAVFFMLGILVIHFLRGPVPVGSCRNAPVPGMLQVPLFSQPGAGSVDISIVNAAKIKRYLSCAASSFTGLDWGRSINLFMVSSGLFSSTTEASDSKQECSYGMQEPAKRCVRVELN